MDILPAVKGRPAAQLILLVSVRRPSWDVPAQNGATRSAARMIYVRISVVFDCEKWINYLEALTNYFFHLLYTV